MRNFLFTDKKSAGWVILITGLSIYYLTGIFPISIFETDSVAISNACQHMINTCQFKENLLGHSYHMQSGTYFLIVLFSKWFHAQTFQTYSLLSALFTILYFILIVLFVKRITGVHYGIIIIVLFLFQEISALAYYPNSTSLAAASWMAGFYMLCKTDRYYLRLLIAGFLLSLAAWFRIDILFVYPSVFLLFIVLKKGIKRAALYSAILALIVVTITLLLMYLMNARVSGFLGYSEYYGSLYGISNTLGVLDNSLFRAHISFFSIILTVFIFLGLVSIIKTKKWMMLLFIISGITFFYLFGTGHFITPKHLAIFIPFWLIVALIGINSIQSMQRFRYYIYISLIMLFLAQYIIGYKFELTNIPYANKPYSLINPEPTFIKLMNVGSIGKKVKNIEIRLGAGTKLPSQDEYLLSSGLIFGPASWYVMKSKTLEGTNALAKYIDTCKITDFTLMVTDGSSQGVINTLFNNKYFWTGDTNNWRQESRFYSTSGKNVFLIRKGGFEKKNAESFTNIFKQVGNKRFVAAFLWDWQVDMMEENHLYTRKLANGMYEIIQ